MLPEVRSRLSCLPKVSCLEAESKAGRAAHGDSDVQVRSLRAEGAEEFAEWDGELPL